LAKSVSVLFAVSEKQLTLLPAERNVSLPIFGKIERGLFRKMRLIAVTHQIVS